MATLQHEACVSPVCEQKVVSLLAVAVGNEQIEPDLCTKVRKKKNRWIKKKKVALKGITFLLALLCPAMCYQVTPLYVGTLKSVLAVTISSEGKWEGPN